jgi:hypothetical protein
MTNGKLITGNYNYCNSFIACIQSMVLISSNA